MKLAIGSAFRNASGNVTAYMRRIRALRSLLGNDVWIRLIAGEGDSVDNTRSELAIQANASCLPIHFVECSHGGRVFGSTEEPDRLAALSTVLNAIVTGVEEEDDLFFYVEQDLLWEPQALRDLIVRHYEADVLAPLVMAGECFYDVWGFRLNGDRFSPFFPFHRRLDHVSGRVLEVDSIGSCALMSGRVAREIRVQNGNAFVGWCEAAKAAGYRIGVVPNIIVRQA